MTIFLILAAFQECKCKLLVNHDQFWVTLLMADYIAYHLLIKQRRHILEPIPLLEVKFLGFRIEFIVLDLALILFSSRYNNFLVHLKTIVVLII